MLVFPGSWSLLKSLDAVCFPTEKLVGKKGSRQIYLD